MWVEKKTSHVCFPKLEPEQHNRTQNIGEMLERKLSLREVESPAHVKKEFLQVLGEKGWERPWEQRSMGLHTNEEGYSQSYWGGHYLKVQELWDLSWFCRWPHYPLEWAPEWTVHCLGLELHLPSSRLTVPPGKSSCDSNQYFVWWPPCRKDSRLSPRTLADLVTSPCEQPTF